MRSKSRVRVGNAWACASGGEASILQGDASPLPSSSSRAVVGVCADHLVTYDHTTTQLHFRSVAEVSDSNATTKTVSNETSCNGVHLPEDVCISRHPRENALRVVMWSRRNVQRHREERAQEARRVYLADIERKSITSIPCDFDQTNAEDRELDIMDGFADRSGDHVVLVDTTSGRLWCWMAAADATDDEENRHETTRERRGEWKRCELTVSGDDSHAHRSEQTPLSCGAGRFVHSSLLGRCFIYIRVTWEKSDAMRLEKWIFDVEMKFSQVQYLSVAIPIDIPQDVFPPRKPLAMQLHMNTSWSHAVVAVHNILVEFSVTPSVDGPLSRHKKSSTKLEQEIVDVAWVDDRSTLAVLVAHGQMLMLSLCRSDSLELLEIETQSTTSKRLSLSTLLNKAVSSASKLIWIESIKKMLIRLGSSAIVFPLELIQHQVDQQPLERPDSNLGTSHNDDGKSFRRRRRQRSSETRVDDELRIHLDQPTSPSAVVLLEVARIAFYESATAFQDIYFTLVSIIYQQMRSGLSSPYPILNESVDQRLIEGVLSLTLSMESAILRQIGSKMLAAPPAFPSRSDRRAYYHNEMRNLSHYGHSVQASVDFEDQSITSGSTASFLQVYLPRIVDLIETLKEVESFETQVAGGQRSKQSISFGQWIVENQFERALMETQPAPPLKSHPLSTSSNARLHDRDTAARDSLLLVLMAYAMACTSLRIDSVALDLQHVLSIAKLRAKPMKTEQIACFFTSLSDNMEHDFLSLHKSRTAPPWNMENALVFARKTQTLSLLVDFCTASKSVFTHECLKDIFAFQAKLFLNSKQISFAERVEATRQFESLHLQVCETYLGEMVGMLRELPLVLEFKRSSKGTEPIHSNAFGCSKDVVTQGFDVYTKQLLMGMDDIDADLPAFREKKSLSSRYWTHASREVRVRSRCLRLKSRVLWHLEQLLTSYEQSLVDIFDRVFLIDFLSGRCGNSEEAKLVAKFIDKAQGAVSCEQWHQERLSFDHYQQLLNRSRGNQTHFRVDKIVRSLAIVVWAIWIRERCAYCLRSIELLNRHGALNRAQHIGDTDKKSIGSLAATCALQLNVLGILVGKPDDIFALQISLLEEAAKLNSGKAAAVVCWAFPADKIQARYLKRYKALRQALKADSDLSTDGPPIEETEHRWQFIQRHVKKSIRSSITSGSTKTGCANAGSPKKHEMSRSWTAEIDVLVDCCCDFEFQRTTWALIQKRFAGGSKALERDDTIKQTAERDQLRKVLLQSRPSTAEGLISRQEVTELLHEQKRELEGKVQSFCSTAQYGREPTATTSLLQVSLPASQTTTSTAQPSDQASSTAIAEKSYTIRGISQDDLSNSGVDEVENQKRKRMQFQQTERRESVQNVLKLLSLRKQHGDYIHRSDSLPNLVGRAGVQRSRSQRGGGNLPVVVDSESTPSPKRHAREADVSRVASFAARAESRDIEDQNTRPRTVPAHSAPASTLSVFPLRWEGDMERSSMKLLDRSSARSISLKTKHISFHQREYSASSDDRFLTEKGDAHGAAIAEETVRLRVASAQTDTTHLELPEYEHDKPGSTDKRIDVSAKAHIGTQSEDNKKDTKDTREASIQCTPQESIRQRGGAIKAVSDDAPNMLSKYPVFIELDSTKSKETKTQKYLQVVRFTDSCTSGASIVSSEQRSHATIASVASEKSAPGSGNEENSHKKTTDSTPLRSKVRERPSRESRPDLLLSHQARYRSHFGISSSSLTSEKSRKGSISRGRHSLLGLKEDMERLKFRLVQLEHCADEIDEDFKESHDKLDRIEKDHDSHEQTVRQHFLDTIDDAFDETGDQRAVEETTGVLSKKASTDIVTAK